jgi:hypothetical protein
MLGSLAAFCQELVYDRDSWLEVLFGMTLGSRDVLFHCADPEFVVFPAQYDLSPRSDTERFSKLGRDNHSAVFSYS